MMLLPTPPKEPSTVWLIAFADELMLQKPGLTHGSAAQCARLAHSSTWLLDPGEAVDWWVAALDNAAKREPRRQDGGRG